jgi:hypothetical protein
MDWFPLDRFAWNPSSGLTISSLDEGRFRGLEQNTLIQIIRSGTPRTNQLQPSPRRRSTVE